MLAIDIFSAYDAWTETLRTQWVEVSPADYVADAGIAD